MDNQATRHIKKILLRMTASCKLSNPITIVLTLPNGPFRPSRGHSLLPWQQPIVISPSNCGIDLPHKSRTPSTCCGLHTLTHPNWHTRSSMDHTIGTVIPLPHLGAKPLSTRMATHEDHGHPAASMLSIWGRQKIITDATIIAFPTHALTVSPDPRNCFRNIASCHP
jgi:hypothetical protein